MNVCCISVCPNNGMTASVGDCLRARRCCCIRLHIETVQSLHWKLTLEEKSFHRGLASVSLLRLAFQSDAVPIEPFLPVVVQWCAAVLHVQHRASQPVVCWTHATQSQSAVGKRLSLLNTYVMCRPFRQQKNGDFYNAV